MDLNPTQTNSSTVPKIAPNDCKSRRNAVGFLEIMQRVVETLEPGIRSRDSHGHSACSSCTWSHVTCDMVLIYTIFE